MNAILETCLHGNWMFTPENGSPTQIRVPGGGWLKQGFDCEAGTYETTLTIPNSGQPQSVRLELGAVNHMAKYELADMDSAQFQTIHEEVTAFTGQCVDLTPYVTAGRSYRLRISVRAYRDGRPVAPHWAEWNECIARGIFRDAYLRVYPDVLIDDVFVKSSVRHMQLVCEVRIANAGATDRTVLLGGSLRSFHGDCFRYPTVPEMAVKVKAHDTVTVQIGSMDWLEGENSFWWPNVPYREGYRAELHLLSLSIHENGQALHTVQTRFGFRELRQAGAYFELNGQRVNFRGDNLQVANYDRIDCGGKGDAIDTLPGFLPPTEGNPGWPKAVDNFLRLNYNVQREHMGPWTPYMLDTCDELGLMLIGESACRWEGFDMENGRGYHEIKCLRDVILACRNHPSIVRWSAKNEAQCPDPEYHLELYDAIKTLDDTRPVFEDFLFVPGGELEPEKVFPLLLNKSDFMWTDHYFTYDDRGQPYFSAMQFNDALISKPDRPFGMTEANWMRSSTPVGLSWFATTVALGRARDASDMRPYVLLSSWVSSVPGVRTTDLLTEENRHPVLGEDNLPDPWAHPGIRLLQTAYHPLLAMDYDFWWLNRKCDMFGHFPTQAPQVQARSTVEREITVFNDEFDGETVELCWEVREGSNANWIWQKGNVTLDIRPGYTAKTKVSFSASPFNTYMFLTLLIRKAGEERFADDRTCFEVTGGEDFRSEFNGAERKFL